MINFHECIRKQGLYKLKAGGYQVSYHDPITRKRRRKLFDRRYKAKAYIHSLNESLYNKDLSEFVNLPIAKLIESHLNACNNSKLTERRRAFGEFYNTFKNHKLSDLTPIRMKEWFEEVRIKYDYSERTMLKIKICLNHFFKWLVESEVIFKSPLNLVRYSESAPARRPRVFLSPTEIAQILENAKVWSRPNWHTRYFFSFLYILAHTGARRSEVLNLRWSNVDFNLNTITFRNTKNGEDRTIVMNKLLATHLSELSKPSEFVISNASDNCVYKNMASRHLETFRRDYPIGKQWTYHSLRHSFAYNYLKKGGNMYQLQAILGHKKISMTIDTYGKILASDDENPSPYDF
jgi:integrase